MTASSTAFNSDAQQLYQQLGDLIDFVRPLADRLMAAGSWDDAVAEAKQMAAEKVMDYVQSQFHGQSAADGMTIDAEPASTGMFTSAPTPNPSLNVGNLLGAVGGMAGGVAGGASMLYVQAGVQGARIVQQGFAQYTETVERERTARHEITAQKDVRIAEIESVRVTLENYLARTFDERRTNFDALFTRLDVAQHNGDLPGMQLVLASILDLAKSSPFKDLASFKASLEDPNFVLEL